MKYESPRPLTSRLADALVVPIFSMTLLLALAGVSVAQTNAPLHNAGEKLFETPEFAVFKNSSKSFCEDDLRTRVNLSVVFKVNADYVVTDYGEYRRRFQAEIFPKIKPMCAASEAFIENYVYNVRLDQKGDEFTTEQPLAVEIPLNRVRIYLDNDLSWYFYVDQVLGNWLDSSSLSRFRKSLVETRNLSAEARERLARMRSAEAERIVAQAKHEARRAELDRQAALGLVRRAAKDLESDRLKVAGMLKLLKRGAPDRYSFEGYQNQSDLRKIYAGETGSYLGEYESDAELELAAVDKFVKGAVNQNFGTMISGLNIGSARSDINAAFYAYQNIYAKRCRTTTDIPWGTSSSFEFFITRDGYRVPGSARDGVVIPVREPFIKRYDAIYSKYVNASGYLSPEIPREWASDFDKFLDTEGCESPAVRQFEINLYLVADWFLPLQVLREPEKATTTLQVEQPKPRRPVAKPKPRGRSRKPTTRP